MEPDALWPCTPLLALGHSISQFALNAPLANADASAALSPTHPPIYLSLALYRLNPHSPAQPPLLSILGVAKITCKSIRLFKPSSIHVMCLGMSQGFGIVTCPLKESSSYEAVKKVSSVEPEKNACKDEELNTRFSNAVANLFHSSLICSNDKKISGMELERNNSTEEMDLCRENSSCVSKISTRPKLWRPPSSYNKMMKAFSLAGKIKEVVRLLREMEHFQYEPNVLFYNTVMNAFVMANRPKEAKVVLKEMITVGIFPNVCSYNILVKMYCLLEQQCSAYNVIDSIWVCARFSHILNIGLCRLGRVEEAWGVFERMEKCKCRPTVHTYTPIIHSYCLEGDIERAKCVLTIMENDGCPPSSVTVNVLIDGLINKLYESRRF